LFEAAKIGFLSHLENQKFEMEFAFLIIFFAKCINFNFCTVTIFELLKLIEMKNFCYLFFLLALSFSSCQETEQENSLNKENKVLMLKVDYLTHTFEGGKELTFSKLDSNFTIESQYQAPGDFGNIKLTYKEINETLFDGSIIWMGKGNIKFPDTILSADKFQNVLTKDFIFPSKGLVNVFNPANQDYDYLPIWSSVQGLVKVREYLKSNKSGKVQLFLYTPSVGIGNPADWDWIVFIKN
jgi:hypothetical protein